MRLTMAQQPVPPPDTAGAAREAANGLRVACLCAAWCHVCTDWRPTFEGTLRDSGVVAHWIDIEDDEDLLEGLEVDDFPTLLIARGGVPVWFGVIAPREAALHQRLRTAVADAPLADEALVRLVQRLARRP